MLYKTNKMLYDFLLDSNHKQIIEWVKKKAADDVKIAKVNYRYLNNNWDKEKADKELDFKKFIEERSVAVVEEFLTQFAKIKNFEEADVFLLKTDCHDAIIYIEPLLKEWLLKQY